MAAWEAWRRPPRPHLHNTHLPTPAFCVCVCVWQIIKECENKMKTNIMSCFFESLYACWRSRRSDLQLFGDDELWTHMMAAASRWRHSSSLKANGDNNRCASRPECLSLRPPKRCLLVLHTEGMVSCFTLLTADFHWLLVCKICTSVWLKYLMKQTEDFWSQIESDFFVFESFWGLLLFGSSICFHQQSANNIVLDCLRKSKQFSSTGKVCEDMNVCLCSDLCDHLVAVNESCSLLWLFLSHLL